MKSISVVFPIYNEEEYVYETLNTFLEVMPTVTDDFEIIGVDDASSDNTPLLLKNLAKGNDKIKILHNDRNKKLGGTLKEGFKIASKELILYSDFDMPFNVKDVKAALQIMEAKNADIISAYRLNRNSDRPIRTLYSYGYDFIIKLIFGIDIININFSFKLFKKTILNSLELKSEGSFINAEFLIKSMSHNFNIVQFPVTYFPRRKGRSTLSRPSVILKIIYELIKFYPELKHGLMARNGL